MSKVKECNVQLTRDSVNDEWLMLYLSRHGEVGLFVLNMDLKVQDAIWFHSKGEAVSHLKKGLEMLFNE